jgi:hypothetical protein
MNPTSPASPTAFSQRYIDPTTGRNAGTVEWDRNWSTVTVSLRTTKLPPVTDMQLFEGPGLLATTEEGKVIVRIDRSSFTARFLLMIDGRNMVPVTDENLAPSPAATPWNPTAVPYGAPAPIAPMQFRAPQPALPPPALPPSALPSSTLPSLTFPPPSVSAHPPEFAPLAAAAGAAGSAIPTVPPGATTQAPSLVQPAGSTSLRAGKRKAAASSIAALVAGLSVVAGGVFALQQWGSSNKQVIAAPTTLPTPTYAVTVPVTYASVYEHLLQQANFYGNADPQAAATCMQTEYPSITDTDIDEFTATYRSAQYRCLPDEMTRQWQITATGIQESDKPCANQGSTNGMAKLTLADMERTMGYSNTADYPPDIQDQLIAELKATCPTLNPTIAERVIKE